MRIRRFLAVAAAILAQVCLVSRADALICATPGRDGIGISISGVVNTYWGSTASVSAGASALVLGPATGAITPIAAGDLLLIIQMQDAQIDSSNSSSYGDGVAGGGAGFTDLGYTGLYEFVRATSSVSTAGGALNVTGAGGGGMVNSYAHADATISRGQRRYQVIRVPQYSNASLGANLSAAPWDGARGGVLVIDVAGELDLAGGVADVTGLGYRGGGGRKLLGGIGLLSTDYLSASFLGANGAKGEGIAGTPKYVASLSGLITYALSGLIDGLPGGSQARGAPGNAGGGATDGNPLLNSRNSGGGGGAGYGGGGRGGHANCPTAPVGCAQSGGFGGAGVSQLSSSRLLPGGGGGAGSNNDGSGLFGDGFGSSGASGGGLIIVRARVVNGSGVFRANGADGASDIDDDGSGGGGGGGSILVTAKELGAGAALSALATGGRGGSNDGGGAAYGPGGGGGGGFILSSVGATTDVTGGTFGTTVNGGVFGAAYGSTSGTSGWAQAGLGASLSVTGILSGYECAPIIEKEFLSTQVSVGGVSRLRLTLVNDYASAPVSAVAFTDVYPSGMINATTPNVSTTCGGSIIAGASTDSLAVSNAIIAAGASCQIEVDVLGGVVGELVNEIATGGLQGTLIDAAVASIFTATASLDVIEPLSAAKTATTISDPLNGEVNPKAVPGAVAEYAIEVSNSSGVSVDNVVVADAIPANSRLLLNDIAAPGSGPVSFTEGAPGSGLSFSFDSLGSGVDSLEFSSDGGASWSYTPSPAGDGTDTAVTNIRVNLTGSHATGGSFTVRFRVVLR